MITVDKIKADILPYVFTLVLLVTLGRYYGRQAIEWILMKLYEFFIAKSHITA
jgi:hypothetical protein